MVREAAKEATAKWFDIGIELGLLPHALEIIKDNYSDVKQCFTQMLLQWLRQVDPPPTWSALAKALKHSYVNHPDIAQRIEKEFINDDENKDDIASHVQKPKATRTAAAGATQNIIQESDGLQSNNGGCGWISRVCKCLTLVCILQLCLLAFLMI